MALIAFEICHVLILLQRLFYVEDSLESAVAGERVAQLIARTEQVIYSLLY